jgi:ribosomal protein L7/L12
MERALESGRRIEAIKVYREATGNDLKASKEFVDALAAELVERDAERFAALTKPRTAGCSTAVWVLVVLGLLGLLLLR